MVHNCYIRCEVCNSITRIRLQVGWQEQHPIIIACRKCGISLSGKVDIGQNEPSLSYNFVNAQQINGSVQEDFAVECSGEFPTYKLSDGREMQGRFITPFIRYQSKAKSDTSYETFCARVGSLFDTSKKWSQYKRVFELSLGGDKKYFIQEVQKILPRDFAQCRNEFEVLRAARLIEIHGFTSSLRPEIIKLPGLGENVLKLNKSQLDMLICFLNEHSGFGTIDLQKTIYKLYDEFVSVFPYLIPAYSLEFCDKEAFDYELEGTSTSSFDEVKQFYLDVYESLGNLLLIPVALDNIKYRNDINSFQDYDVKPTSMERFIEQTKANRFHVCGSQEYYVKMLGVSFNQKLRNAIGHNDVEYDTVSQKITYIPNPKDRARKETQFLLEFEEEAISMFKAVLVISEYLYRIRELELINQGAIPIKPDIPIVKPKKISRNDSCPCGSGIKYKFCHGKRT